MKIDYFFDPVCPYCWQTSCWVRIVEPLRDLEVDWRFISLKMLNEERSYEGKPVGYADSHATGLALLRIAAAVKAELGPDPIGAVYRELGTRIWNATPRPGLTRHQQNGRFGSEGQIIAALEAAGVPTRFADAANDAGFDAPVRADLELALSRTGKNVGTPIITYGAPDGPSYFGPVISRVPDEEDSLRLWDAMVTLGTIPSFAEIKRSMREPVQLPLMGH
jgi:hypothetical protein